MKTPLAMLSALVLHAVLGSACMMMPMTTMAAEAHEDPVMAMTHMDLPPTSGCEHCSHLERNGQSAPACEGHCLANANDSMTVTVPSMQLPIGVPAPVVMEAAIRPSESDDHPLESGEPPGTALRERTVVSRE